SGAARHLLPRGEKDDPAFVGPSSPPPTPPSPLVGEGAPKGRMRGPSAHGTPAASPPPIPPSPLVGEGARRADEGAKERSDPRLQRLARSMRHQPTEAEKKLWLLLRDRRFVGHKFRRQVPIGPYIADF